MAESDPSFDIPAGSPFRGVAAALFLLIAMLLSLAAIFVVLLLDSQQRTITPTPAPTQIAFVARQFTAVPVVSAIPPSSTPTATATSTLTPTLTATPTNTPVPPTATPLPPTSTRKPPTAVPAKPTEAAKRCVSVVGDSVAHGDAVFEVPGMGYFEAQLAPVSAFIEQQYRQRGDSTILVYNRSASAVGISSGNHPSYFNTVQYAQLLQDNCAYIVIIPWLNDLSTGTDPDTSAANHISALGGFVRTLANANVHGKIIVLNYYQSSTAPFALRTFASGATAAGISAFNQQLAAACSSGSLLLPQVRCLDSNAAFSGMGTSYVMGATSQHDLGIILTIPVNGPELGMVNAYFSANPNGVLGGDGIHLSNSGKAALAAYLVSQMP